MIYCYFFRFHTITTSYYRGAMGIMLVYDITNAKSFDNIAKWLRNIDEHANEDVERMILGNKCDMEDKRVVSKERGEEIAREHNIKFLETSAKVSVPCPQCVVYVVWPWFRMLGNTLLLIQFQFQTNINIETAFIELAEAILDKSNVQDTKPAPFPQPAQAAGPRCPGCSQ